MGIEFYKCPNCGSNIDIESGVCSYCGTNFRITRYKQLDGLDTNLIKKLASSSIDSICDVNLRAGMCYLKLKQFSMALVKINMSIDVNPFYADAYYYKVFALLDGKKPFLHNKARIVEIERCLQDAIAIEEKAKYYFLLAIIKYDYYARKSFLSNPNYEEVYKNAIALDLTSEDISEVYEIIGTSWEEIFK